MAASPATAGEGPSDDGPTLDAQRLAEHERLGDLAPRRLERAAQRRP
jgi:hypothetical protein